MSLFQTQANTGFNSFQNPLNPANSNGGNWNIDSSYLTPSYAAPYRPQYQGPTGAPPPNYNVGFARSAYGVMSPTAPSYMYGDTVNQEDPYFSALGYRPGDAAMWGAQRAILPALAFTAAMKASSYAMTSNSQVYSWVSQNARMLGGAAPSAAAHAAAHGMGMGAHMGASVGRGLARGITGGMGAMGIGGGGAGAAAFMGAGAGIGALAGSVIAPLAMAQAGLSVADSAFFDPYSATRNTERNLRQNFSNVNMGGGAGAGNITGFGMNRTSANRMASNLTQSSIKDMTFDTYGMQDLTDFASRAGMLDNAQIGQMESKMKAIAKQVKVMMRVANEPDFRAAMSMLGELKVGGVSEGIAGRVMQNIGANSAIGGISSQQMMNTVGAQGQYLYQANNLTPYIGQTNAAASYGAFSSAFRMGLISDATMARFGGREGATQLSMSGQVNGAQTPYNRMMMMNQYMGGGAGGGVVGNLAKFGQNVAADPLAATGAFEMYGHEMVSRQLMEKGTGAILGQLGDIGGIIPGMKNKNGSIDVEKAFLLMTRQMGLPEMEAKAMLKEMYAYHDPKVRGQMTSALSGNTTRDMMKGLEQEGMGYGALNGAVHGTRSAWKNFKGKGARIAGDISGMGAAMGDSLQEGFYGLKFGSLVNGTEADTFDQFTGGSASGGLYALDTTRASAMRSFDLGTELGPMKLVKDGYSFFTGKDLLPDNGPALETINNAAKSGDKDAQIVVNPKASKKDRSDALQRMGMSNKLGNLSSQQVSSLTEEVLGLSSKKVGSKESVGAGRINKGLTAALGKDLGMLKGISMVDAASRVALGDESGVAEMKSVYGENMSLMDLKDKAKSIVKSAAENNVFHLSAIMGGKSVGDLTAAASAGSTDEFGPYASEVKAKIAAIKGNKDLSEGQKTAEIEKAVTFYRSKVRNVKQSSYVDGSNLPSGVSAETIVGLHENLRESADRAQQINSMAAQGVINFDTQYSSLAANNLSGAVDKFGVSVSAFEKAVKGMDGGKGADALPFESWNPFSSGSREKNL